MTKNVVIGIIVLFCVSLLVRILPAFIRWPPMSNDVQESVKSILPIAVFINLLTYCLVSEISENHLAALLGFIILFSLLVAVKRLGLLATVCVASAVFILLKHLATTH